MQGRPVFVDVYAHFDKNRKIKFCHDWRLQEHGPNETSVRIVVPKGTPRSPIHFRLYDETGRQLRFFNDAEESMWARVGQCPNAAGGGGQIDFSQAVSTGPNLTVHNLNSAKCNLHYALRFEDKDGRVVSYDPEIRNGGTT